MTTTLIKNLTVVTLDEQGSLYKDTNLLVEDKQIKHIGDLPEDFQADTVIDGSGKAAMPGLFNSHCHTPMILIRGWAEDMLFPQWLQKIWVAESGLTDEDVYWAASLAAVEMVRSGTIAFNEHYFYMDKIAEVVRKSGMKAALAWCVFGEGEGTSAGPALQQAVEWSKGQIESGEERIKVFLGPHSPYTCDRAFLEQTVKLAHDMGTGIHLHLSESPEQVSDSMEQHGMSPVFHVDRMGLLDVPGSVVAAHALHVDEADIELMAEKNVCTPHCPNTYMKLSMPFYSLKSRLDAGVVTPLGTDGPASNAVLDMFMSIRQTALMHKYLQLDPQFMGGDLPLRMATQVGAKAMGFADSGSLESGKAADFILINTDQAHLQPEHNLAANLVHSTYGSDVTDMMVDGQWLMRDRELKTLDEERIIAEVKQRAKWIADRALRVESGQEE